MNQKLIDLNSMILAIINVVFVGTLFFYCLFPFPPVLDGYSLIIYFLMVLQMNYFLYYEKKYRNPFILLHVFVMAVYYLPRFMTMQFCYGYGIETLNRLSPVTLDEMNHALLFILFANLFIFFGLAWPNKQSRRILSHSQSIIGNGDLVLVHPLIPMSMLGLVIVAGFYLVYFEGAGRVGGLVDMSVFMSYLSILLNYDVVLLFVFTWMLFYTPVRLYELSRSNEIVKKYRQYKKYVLLMFVLFAFMRVVVGSRSFLLPVIMAYMFCALVAGVAAVERKYLVYLAGLIFVSLVTFNVATYSRTLLSLDESKTVNIADYQRSMVDFSKSDESAFDFQTILLPVFSRISFLDYAVDLIRNSESYQEVVNLAYYVKSLVDAFTPGFDVFDFPLASNAMRHVYAGVPLSRNLGTYQSDHLSIYGEYYTLFGGWFSLPLFGLVAYMFQRIYANIWLKNGFSLLVVKAFILYIYFQHWLCSYGTDWLITDGARAGVALIIVLYIGKLTSTYRLNAKGAGAGRVAVRGPHGA